MSQTSSPVKLIGKEEVGPPLRYQSLFLDLISSNSTLPLILPVTSQQRHPITMQRKAGNATTAFLSGFCQ